MQRLRYKDNSVRMVVIKYLKKELLMDLVDCVLTRGVTRAYKPTPVPKELLTKILGAARNCASAGNTQPWEFAIFGGQVMEEMRKANQERHLAGAPPNSEIPHGPRIWSESFLARIMGRGEPTLLSTLGIDPNDVEARQQLWLKGIGFWGAPNGIVIYVEQNLPTLSMVDAGGVLQTILLLAHNYGLGCCPSMQMVSYPDIVRKFLSIPSSKMIVIGLCIGYADDDHPANKFKSFRLPLEEMVTWHGI